MIRGLRAKLVIIYTTLSILAVISLSLFVDSRLQDLLIERLTSDLEAQAGLVAEAVGPDLAGGDWGRLRDYIQRADERADARILVVGKTQGMVVATDEESLPSWTEARLKGGVEEAFEGRPTKELSPGQPSAAELVYVAEPVVHDGVVVGAVRLSYQLRDVEGTFRRVQYAIGLGALATALVTAGLGLLIAARIARPLRALSRAAHALAEGDLSQRVTVRASDEVGELVESFNTMAARLREHDVARREFASDVSHELRSLASAMQTAAEALDRGARRDPALLDRLVSGLVQHTRRLGRLADDLLELARLEGGRMDLQFEPADLAEIARLSAAEFTAEAERLGLRLMVDVPEPLLTRADPARLSQALGNLVENALKYSPRGASITVRARRDSSDRFALDVQDEGSGIPVDVLTRVFERYYRVEGRASGGPGGMGLGLSIVAGIARAHGGSADARPGAARGTIFTIHLPRVGPEAAGVHVTTSQARAVSRDPALAGTGAGAAGPNAS